MAKTDDEKKANPIAPLVNRTITTISRTIAEIEGVRRGSDKIVFTCSDDTKWVMYHNKACSQCDVDVWLEDICGDMADLIGSPVVRAEVSTSRWIRDTDSHLNFHDKHDKRKDRFTWTFYILGTAHGRRDEKKRFRKLLKETGAPPTAKCSTGRSLRS